MVANGDNHTMQESHRWTATNEKQFSNQASNPLYGRHENHEQTIFFVSSLDVDSIKFIDGPSRA